VSRPATRACLIAVATAAALAAAVPQATAGDGIAAARAGTARFHDLAAATDAGFGLFTDRNGVACIDDPAGGMGVHYANGTRVADPTVVAGAPEVLVYEPQADGRMRLVAVEYVVLKAAWEQAGNVAPPSLFGETFELAEPGNRYMDDAFYELHAWVWKHNARGMHEDWNDAVSCDA